MQLATRQLWPTGSLRKLTLETLLGLLISTGLRIGEALRLTIRDVQVDREPPRLEIYHTKFRKSRFVPVHPTTADRLRAYLRQRYKLAGRGSVSAFFLRAPDNPLHNVRRCIASTRLPSSSVSRGSREDVGPPCMPFGTPSPCDDWWAGIEPVSMSAACYPTSRSIWDTLA